MTEPENFPVGSGKAKRRNPIARLFLRVFFQLFSGWCLLIRKLTFRIEKPREVGREMTLHGAMESRTIWMLWDTGWESAPALAKLSYDSWVKRNPGWQVRMLDRDEALALTSIPLEVAAKRMKPSQFADLVRLELLTQYGGVWADATTFCEVPLDDWLPAAMPFGFFAFAIAEQKTVATWFIAARRNNAIVRAWRDMAYSFWSCSERPTTYLMFYDFFRLAMWRNREAAKMWKFSAKLERTAENVLRYEYLNRDLNSEFASLLARKIVPLHKFSLRESIPESFSGTPLEQVFGFSTRAELDARAAGVELLPKH